VRSVAHAQDGNLSETELGNPLPYRKILLSLPLAKYGSSKTQNFENAAAHAQGFASLARAAVEQMPTVRQQRRVAYRVSFLRLL
jgi:hypothetical protein